MRTAPVYIYNPELIAIVWVAQLVIIMMGIYAYNDMNLSKPMAWNVFMAIPVTFGILAAISLAKQVIRGLRNASRSLTMCVLLIIFLIAVPLLAFGSEYHTVSWFASHPSERASQLRWCRDNPALATPNITPNCINAEESGWSAPERTAPRQWVNQQDIDHCAWLAKLHIRQDPLIANQCAAALASGQIR